MKKVLLLTCTIAAICSTSAGATSEDRIDLGGLTGIKHSENFEYVCAVTDSSEVLKMFLDIDFSPSQKYRLATAFPNGPIGGAVGVEAPIVSESTGRCGNKVCALVVMKTDASDPGQEMTFLEGQPGKLSVSGRNLDTGAKNASGTCTLNEVP